MYDTVNFRLPQSDAGGIDLLSEIPYFLDDVAEHNYNGDIVLTGNLNGFRISINKRQIKVKDSSLCKWYLGNNFQTMGLCDTQRAIEALSDALHLDMNKAIVTRLDIAQNMIMKYPTEVYLNHLGLLKHAVRLEEPNGLYYKLANGRLCFYDKTIEQKSNRDAIPDLYLNKNVLRYEQRYTERIAAQLKVSEVTGASLYNETFYINLLNKWKDAYMAIQKINDIQINFSLMRTKKELHLMGILSLVMQAGGQTQMITQINNSKKMGIITKKQAFDLRTAINDACKVRDCVVIESKAINELDKKVIQAAMFYR